MNWYVVVVAALVGCLLATAVMFACMMANIEYGTRRASVIFGVVTGVLLAADALLLGAVT